MKYKVTAEIVPYFSYLTFSYWMDFQKNMEIIAKFTREEIIWNTNLMEAINILEKIEFSNQEDAKACVEKMENCFRKKIKIPWEDVWAEIQYVIEAIPDSLIQELKNLLNS